MRKLLTLLAVVAAGSGAVAQTVAPVEPVPTVAPPPPAAPVAPAPVAAPAPAPVAAPAPPAAPAMVLSEDRRERIVQLCTAEAQRRGAEKGMTQVALKDVKDTDLKSNGFASMRATMTGVTTTSKGKTKSVKKTVGCQTGNDVVTGFEVD